MNAHDILKQKILDTEEDHTTGITSSRCCASSRSWSRCTASWWGR